MNEILEPTQPQIGSNETDSVDPFYGQVGDKLPYTCINVTRFSAPPANAYCIPLNTTNTYMAYQYLHKFYDYNGTHQWYNTCVNGTYSDPFTPTPADPIL